jgi:hypothetical protein
VPPAPCGRNPKKTPRVCYLKFGNGTRTGARAGKHTRNHWSFKKKKIRKYLIDLFLFGVFPLVGTVPFYQSVRDTAFVERA